MEYNYLPHTGFENLNVNKIAYRVSQLLVHHGSVDLDL